VELKQCIFELARQLSYPKKQNAWKQCIKHFTFRSHIFLISYLFWVIWKTWVHQFKLYNLLLAPSAIELRLNVIFEPHISFFVHFEQSLPRSVHQVKVHNTSFKPKHNQDMFKDFELFEYWNVQTPTYLPSLQKLKKKTLLNGLYGTC